MSKAFLEDAVVELVYKFNDEKSANSTRSLPRVFEKVSQQLNCHSNFFGGHMYIYTYI